MPVIWAAISAHGYGHAAQVVPVLNALGSLVPKLTAVLRTTVPGSFFQDRLTIPWALQSVQQDVGCIQQGPLRIDVPATWEEHARFHARWGQRVEEEVAAIRAARPRVIVADTPYLACSAGAEAGIPTVGLTNFTWSEVLKPFLQQDRLDRHELVEEIELSYGRADFAFRIAPGLPLAPYRTVMDIGPIAQPATPERRAVRTHLGIRAAERLVLVGFGGIPLPSLPWDRMERMTGYRFIADSSETRLFSRIHRLSTLPFSFKTLLASVDAIITKPGYGTVVEAVALKLPVLYVRRHNFADEQPLVDFLMQHGSAQELSLDDFSAGLWQAALDDLLARPPKERAPSCSGATEAAEQFARFF